MQNHRNDAHAGNILFGILLHQESRALLACIHWCPELAVYYTVVIVSILRRKTASITIINDTAPWATMQRCFPDRVLAVLHRWAHMRLSADHGGSICHERDAGRIDKHSMGGSAVEVPGGTHHISAQPIRSHVYE